MIDHDIETCLDCNPGAAHLGETATVQPGEWWPLDDHGTEIYVYGGKHVDIAYQVGAEEKIRQLQDALQPHRGDAVETWIKQQRDAAGTETDDAWRVLDGLLDDYREHADCGVPLGQEIAGPEAGRA